VAGAAAGRHVHGRTRIAGLQPRAVAARRPYGGGAHVRRRPTSDAGRRVERRTRARRRQRQVAVGHARAAAAAGQRRVRATARHGHDGHAGGPGHRLMVGRRRAATSAVLLLVVLVAAAEHGFLPVGRARRGRFRRQQQVGPGTRRRGGRHHGVHV